MPVLPVSLFEPIWAEFSALLPDRPAVDPAHPLGCHRRRIPDRVVFEHVVDALVHGSGYERIATAGCSDRTIRRRVRAWADAGLAETRHRLALEQDDRMIGLELGDLAVDGCVTKAPCGGACAGRSPVDRGRAGAHPGGQALGGRAHPGVDERLRQAAPLPREARHGRRRLPVPGRRRRRHPPAHPAGAHALPVGRPPHDPTAHVTPIAGRSKRHALVGVDTVDIFTAAKTL